MCAWVYLCHFVHIANNVFASFFLYLLLPLSLGRSGRLSNCMMATAKGIYSHMTRCEIKHTKTMTLCDKIAKRRVDNDIKWQANEEAKKNTSNEECYVQPKTRDSKITIGIVCCLERMPLHNTTHTTKIPKNIYGRWTGGGEEKMETKYFSNIHIFLLCFAIFGRILCAILAKLCDCLGIASI